MAYLWVGTTSTNLVAVKTPSSLTWGKIMVSADDAGRVQQDARMFVNKVADKVTLNLAWNALKSDDVAKILTAFDHEYIFVRYHDPKTNSFVTKEMYPGDMSAPVYSYWSNNILYQNVTFQVIER